MRDPRQPTQTHSEKDVAPKPRTETEGRKTSNPEPQSRSAPVEVMGANVGQDLGWQKARTVAAQAELLADPGGTGRLGDSFQEMNAFLLRGGEGQRIELLLERKAGAADDNPVGQGEETIRLAPAAEIEKGVCAHQNEDGVARRSLCTKPRERVDGVVGAFVAPGRLKRGGNKSRFSIRWLLMAEEIDHGEPIVERRLETGGFERLTARGDEEHFVEREAGGRGPRDGQMAGMGRVEAAAEVAEAHAAL